MVRRIILAVVVAIAVALGAGLAGTLLQNVDASAVRAVGNFLQDYSTVIGILAGLWYYFAGDVGIDR